VRENLCCVGILGWSENERMMDYGGVVGRRLGKMKVLFYFLDLNIHLVPIFVKIIQFGSYFRCLFNLVIIFVKSYSIESF